MLGLFAYEIVAHTIVSIGGCSHEPYVMDRTQTIVCLFAHDVTEHVGDGMTYCSFQKVKVNVHIIGLIQYEQVKKSQKR